MITGAQVRAARALLRMEQVALAEAAGVGLETVKRIESTDGEWKGRVTSIDAVQRALERAGVEFFESEMPLPLGESGPEARRRGSGVRFASDPTAKFRKIVAAEVAGLVDGILLVELAKDPKFSNKDPAYIAEKLVESLVPLIRRSLPTRLMFT
jgi:hypothetical protein